MPFPVPLLINNDTVTQEADAVPCAMRDGAGAGAGVGMCWCWNVLGLDRLIGLIECCNNTTLKIIVDNFKIVIEIIILC
jgi:hypothetical protein